MDNDYRLATVGWVVTIFLNMMSPLLLNYK